MSIKWKEMVAGATLSGAATQVFITPALSSETIQQATVYNPTGAPVTFSLYKVPAGLAVDNSTLICTRSIPAGQCVQANEAINHKLQAGTALWALGTGLTLNISGVEYVPVT